MHPDSDPILREHAVYAACYCAVGEYQLFRAVRAGEYTPPLYDPSHPYEIDAHEYAEGNWQLAQSVVDKMLLHNYRDLATLVATERAFPDVAQSLGFAANLDDPAHEVLACRAHLVSDLASKFEERGAALPLVGDRAALATLRERRDLQEPAPSLQPELEEDELKKHGRGGGDPSLSQIAHNIRPDVESAPGGLVVVTTAKNSERPRDDEATARPTHPDAAPGDAATDQPRRETLSERLAATFARIEARLFGEDRSAAAERVDGRHDDEAPSTVYDPVAEHREDATRRYADESSRRQEDERRAANGEDSLPESRGSLTDRLTAKFERAERNAEREQEEAREALGVDAEGKMQSLPELPTGRDL